MDLALVTLHTVDGLAPGRALCVGSPCLVTPGAERRARERGIEIVVTREPDPSLPRIRLASYFDSTLLASDATPDQITQLAREALAFRVAAVCVNPLFVPVAAGVLKGTGIAVASVVGFPLGASTTEIKAAEAARAVADGASEIDLVMPIGLAKSADWAAVARDVRGVRAAVPAPDVVLKVIIEAPLLSDEETERATESVVDAGADFVKSGTGTAGEVTRQQVERIARALRGRARIKAAGGIREMKGAMELLDAGAHRLGTSRAVQLLQEALRLAV